jgi:hypothetical protein
VPCPITDTSHLLLPNGRDFMVMVLPPIATFVQLGTAQDSINLG